MLDHQRIVNLECSSLLMAMLLFTGFQGFHLVPLAIHKITIIFFRVVV